MTLAEATNATPDLAQRLNREQLRLFLAENRLSPVFIAVVAFFLCLSLTQAWGLELLPVGLWFGLLSLINIASAVLSFRLRQLPAPGTEARWEWAFAVLAGATTFMWSMGLALVRPEIPGAIWNATAIVVIGGGILSIAFALVRSMPAAVLALTGLCLPAIVALLINRTASDLFGAVFLAVIYGTTIFACFNQYRSRRRAVQLRLQNEELIARLNADVAARAIKEQELAESRERLQFVLAANAQMDVEFDAQGRLLYISPVVHDLTGGDPADLTGRNFVELVHRDDLPVVNRAFDRLLATSKPVTSLEYRTRHRDGRWVWQSINMAPVLDQAGRVTKIAGICHDISERKQQLAQIEADKAQLERQAIELLDYAAQLSAVKSEADEARRRAEAANRSKSEFMAMTSHELRTPLNSVLGFSELIAESPTGKADPKIAEYAGDIHAAGQHLLALINDILDLAKLEAGRVELHAEALDLGELAAACTRLVRGLARDKGVNLINRVADDAGALWADPRASRQMLVNLLSNACKFTPKGGEVTLDAVLGFDGWVTIAISDSGIGMSESDIARALETYGQVDNVMTRTQRGTGLGLPLVKGLIELHGGKLMIQSTPGRGTTASLHFPPQR